MGGAGDRFGSALPKQFHRLCGQKIYLHTLKKFLDSTLFHEILLVTPSEWLKEVAEDLSCYKGAPIRIVEGGGTRQESSYRGLLACTPDTHCVIVHDAVRPFVSGAVLAENVSKAAVYGAVDTCIPSTDTIVHSVSGESIDTIPLRAEYFQGQTPQSFHYAILLKAHQETKQSNASDDCALVLERGHTVHLVRGEATNIKITTPLDLFLAEQLLRMEHTTPPVGENSVAGKVFAITGGTGGIGSALATLLEKEGATPLLLARGAPHFPFDLSSYSNVETAFLQIHEKYGALDGLINCMGMLKVKNVEHLSHTEISQLINTNLAGPIYCCKCVQIKNQGHLINVASSSYSRGRKSYAVYSSAKAALVNFTQGLAEERPHLFINAVVPGRTNTRMRQEQFPSEETEHMLSAEEVASSILNLLKQTRLTGTLVKV